jgi:hypothetical protein
LDLRDKPADARDALNAAGAGHHQLYEHGTISPTFGEISCLSNKDRVALHSLTTM